MESIKDIRELITDSSSSDGETHILEHKGTDGKQQFTRCEKKKLSKEICALANTYGGHLCFHFGNKESIEPFPAGYTSKIYDQLEGWLSNCLEPSIQGITLEIIDDIFLIYIPESKNKPHRTNSTKEYFYRHVTQSTPMPEIMISSMYKSQSYLDVVSNISVNKTNKQFSLHTNLQNQSNIAGTKPRIEIQIFSSDPKKIGLGAGKDFTQSTQWDQHYSLNTFSIFPQLVVNTKSIYAEEILYPKDRKLITLYTSPIQNIGNIKYLMVRFDCMFLETSRRTLYRIFDVENSCRIIECSDKTNIEDVIYKFSRLKLQVSD